MNGPTGFNVVTIRDIMDPLKAPLTKQYYVNDADGDPTDIYHAQSTAGDSAACLRQRFEFASVSGVKNVVKSSWESATWDASWDIS